MAHIASFMADVPGSAGLNNYIARELSPSPPIQNVTSTEAADFEDKKDYVWRMHQPTESTVTRKYQLFPSKEKLSTSKKSAAEPSTSTITKQGTMEQDQKCIGNSLRLKSKEENMTRRRKVSVPELGPMTTVQEVPMDSPTIPGRPPLHERSASAPGNSSRQQAFAESILSCVPGPTVDEQIESAISYNSQGSSNIGPLPPLVLPSALSIEQPFLMAPSASQSEQSRQPLSPKMLTPLVIPQSSLSQPFQRFYQSPSKSRLRTASTQDDDVPPEVPPKSARIEASPLSRASPFTPMSASSTIASISTAPTSVNNTPAGEGRSSPKQWNSLPSRSSPKPWIATGRSSPKPLPSNTSSSAPNASMSMQRNNSDLGISNIHTLQHQRSFPKLTAQAPSQGYSHRRQVSEGCNTISTATSIMDRGRPKKRSDGSPIKRMAQRSPSNPAMPTPILDLSISHSPARSTGSSRPMALPGAPEAAVPQTTEQKAFEHLPAGHPSLSAHSYLPSSELSQLRAQALSQAHRFHVLPSRDVDSLSRELRALDERCTYLRTTHRSLRSGRRNLHDRICTYMRSSGERPRSARFSGDAMLKQEEALRELDVCIDDWYAKLEAAENRRMRVRQKLLEHVAAALIVQTTPTGNSYGIESSSGLGHVIENMVARGEDTPPRSPVKSSSPDRERGERLSRVVEEVPVATTQSTLPAEAPAFSSPTSPTRQASTLTIPTGTDTLGPRKGREVLSALSSASIKIYADSDVYALMDCVEEEIHRIGEEEESRVREAAKRSEQERQHEERRLKEKRDDTILAGITLNAVTFEGMGAYSRRGSPAREGSARGSPARERAGIM